MSRGNNPPYMAPYVDCSGGTGQNMTCEVWTTISHDYYEDATGNYVNSVNWSELPMNYWVNWQANGSYGPWLQNISFDQCTNVSFQDMDYGVDANGNYRVVVVTTEQRNCTTNPPTV